MVPRYCLSLPWLDADCIVSTNIGRPACITLGGGRWVGRRSLAGDPVLVRTAWQPRSAVNTRRIRPTIVGRSPQRAGEAVESLRLAYRSSSGLRMPSVMRGFALRHGPGGTTEPEGRGGNRSGSATPYRRPLPSPATTCISGADLL